MALDNAMPVRLVRWLSATEPDWEAVYNDQLPRVYNFFRYRFGDTTDVEDLTARTFEKAWRARTRYRRDLAGFSTWLLSIARNVAVDHLRARKPHVPIEEADAVTTFSNPEDDAARQSDSNRLALLMSQLPDRDREILALKYGAGFNNRAISRATGLSESNVGTIVHRAVQTIRTQW
jgi:RNA polymerase sigma-70 factor (ECF subfamily)